MKTQVIFTLATLVCSLNAAQITQSTNDVAAQLEQFNQMAQTEAATSENWWCNCDDYCLGTHIAVGNAHCCDTVYIPWYMQLKGFQNSCDCECDHWWSFSMCSVSGGVETFEGVDFVHGSIGPDGADKDLTAFSVCTGDFETELDEALVAYYSD